MNKPILETIETLVPSSETLVFAEGSLMTLREAKALNLHKNSYYDLCEGSVDSAFVANGGSLLLSDNKESDLKSYARRNGITVTFAQTEKPLFIGFVLLGNADIIIDDEKKQVAIMETTHQGFPAKISSLIVDNVVEMLEIDTDSVQHFSPKPHNSNVPSLSRLFSRKTQSPQDAVVGSTVTAILPDGSVSQSYGVLEPLAKYRERLG